MKVRKKVIQKLKLETFIGLESGKEKKENSVLGKGIAWLIREQKVIQHG